MATRGREEDPTDRTLV